MSRTTLMLTGFCLFMWATYYIYFNLGDYSFEQKIFFSIGIAVIHTLGFKLLWNFLNARFNSNALERIGSILIAAFVGPYFLPFWLISKIALLARN